MRTWSEPEVPPPARRSSRHLLAGLVGVDGSSARAEIVPHGRTARVSASRFLGLRGGQSGLRSAQGGLLAVPPPACALSVPPPCWASCIFFSSVPPLAQRSPGSHWLCVSKLLLYAHPSPVSVKKLT